MKNALLTLKDDPILRKELVERGKKRLEIAVPSWDEIVGSVLIQEGIEVRR